MNELTKRGSSSLQIRKYQIVSFTHWLESVGKLTTEFPLFGSTQFSPAHIYWIPIVCQAVSLTLRVQQRKVKVLPSSHLEPGKGDRHFIAVIKVIE